jgi:ankyrin repeat protein
MNILLLASLPAAIAASLWAASGKERELLDSVRKGDTAKVDKLVGSDPSLVNARDSDGVPAVRLALYYRQPEIARILIERGAALDFHDAAASGRVERLRELIAGDPAIVNGRSADGATAIGLAAFFGHRDAVELLLDRGAHIDMLCTNPAFPFTALHSAMSAGHRAIVELLLGRGANVNVREGGGMTVLHEAAGLGSLDYVELLLARGADPNAKTDDGKLPGDFARARNFATIAELLVAARGRR